MFGILFKHLKFIKEIFISSKEKCTCVLLNSTLKHVFSQRIQRKKLFSYKLIKLNIIRILLCVKSSLKNITDSH